MESAKVKHVVVDSGAFIRNAPLRDIGENIYSLQDVVQEIRDKATRQRLQVLPYELLLRNPSPEAISKVNEFARKTGDYRSLSRVDIKVIALAYDLEKEHVGTDHIKAAPDKKVQWEAVRGPLEKPTEIVGFYLQQNKPSSSRTVSECSSLPVDSTPQEGDLTSQLSQVSLTDAAQTPNNTQESTPEASENTQVSTHTDSTDAHHTTASAAEAGVSRVLLEDGSVLQDSCLAEEEEELSGSEESDGDDDEGFDDEDDEDEGWITPQNLRAAKQAMGDSNTERATVEVACVTTDFAMQNVLIQLGLNVVSVDGMLIRKARSYVLRCRACFKVTTSMEKQFCPHCGNPTLEKISMTVGEDGSIVYHLSRKKPVSRRGQRYSLPAPKGGKHANNPILFEDQREAQQKGSKSAKGKQDVFSPDYSIMTSPFSLTDVHSRAAQLGISGRKVNTFGAKRNPNENKKNYGRRK